MHLLHSDIFTHLFVSSSTTCPSGHAHIGRSHTAGVEGLLQVALSCRQLGPKDCPSAGHGTTVQKLVNNANIISH